MSKTLNERAQTVVADARANYAKPATANLAEFRKFAGVVVGPVLRSEGFSAKETDAILDAAAATAKLYSRYQDAKRAGVLETILAPAPKRAPRAPKAAPAESPAE